LQGTVFGNWYDDKRKAPYRQTKGESPIKITSLPSEEEAAFMYKYAAGYLRSKGYEHYEVSSYAANSLAISRRSIHNQLYWATDSHWYAIGLGATSFVGGALVARPRALVDYIRWVSNQGEKHDREYQSVDEIDLVMDIVLKRLRTLEGLSLNWIRSRFQKGEAYTETILLGAQLGIQLGLAYFDEATGQLRLSEPEGFMYSNSIISSVFAELEHRHGALFTIEHN
jgi:coproporphyrinogen III oxidase-like Fe-S oxidoreductase